MATSTTLTASLQARSDALELDYTVTNRGTLPLYLVDVSIAVGAEGTSVTSALPRVEFGKDCEVLLSSRLRPLDPRRDYAAPPSAYVSLLEAGDNKRQTARLPFPLVPANLPTTKDVEEIVCDRIVFVLGVIPADGSVRATELQISGIRLWRLPAYEAALRQQELTVAAIVPGTRVLAHKPNP